MSRSASGWCFPYSSSNAATCTNQQTHFNACLGHRSCCQCTKKIMQQTLILCTHA